MARQGTDSKRRRVSAREHRQAISAAALETFLESGFAGARTKIIADRAGVAEAQMYRLYESKRELFEEVVLGPLADWVRMMPAVVDVTDDERDPVEFVRDTNASLLRAMEMVAPLLGVALFSGTDGKAFYLTRFRPMLEAWIGTIQRALDKAGLTSNREVARSIAFTALGRAWMQALDGSFSGPSPDRDADAQNFAQLLTYGLAGLPRSDERSVAGRSDRL